MSQSTNPAAKLLHPILSRGSMCMGHRKWCHPPPSLTRRLRADLRPHQRRGLLPTGAGSSPPLPFGLVNSSRSGTGRNHQAVPLNQRVGIRRCMRQFVLLPTGLMVSAVLVGGGGVPRKSPRCVRCRACRHGMAFWDDVISLKAASGRE